MFANLDSTKQAKYIHSGSNYSFGWSHGKEKLEGTFDLAKGSFYANPQHDNPSSDVEIIKKYPEFVHPNIWPKEELPELELAFKELGTLIVSVGHLIAKQCDQYVSSRCSTYTPNLLEGIVANSICCKARLLHYFPQTVATVESHSTDETDTQNFSSWCGWHNDHSALTGEITFYNSIQGQGLG